VHALSTRAARITFDDGASQDAGKYLFPVASARMFDSPWRFAQSVGTTGNVPGGITLVPGTIVTPQVGGSAATGRVPLAGLPGSPGVRNFDPQLAPPAVTATAANIASRPIRRSGRRNHQPEHLAAKSADRAAGHPRRDSKQSRAAANLPQRRRHRQRPLLIFPPPGSKH
jgi:hypothetical protein